MSETDEREGVALPVVEDAPEVAPDYLQMARDSYTNSTDYMTANLRRQWERNISNFFSRHPVGSKYHTASYLSRSRIFRPKTRAAIRQNEAAVVAAFFSTQDVVSIQPENPSDPNAQISADLLMALVNYRLTGSSIPWFKILIGAYQDTCVYGVCIANIEWHYEEKATDKERVVGAKEDGTLISEPVFDVTHDRPEIRLVAPENFRIDPGADWLDPINSSPYIIELIPMYVKDIKARASTEGGGRQPWHEVSAEEMLTAANENASDSTRLARETGRQDPKDQASAVTDHTLIWVHRNIFQIDGVDHQFYTLGTTALLSDPIQLDKVVLHGRRPYRMGSQIIETHRNNPSALAELGQELQAATNDNFNQRFDNIKLALNSRSYVRRAASVDLRALKRSVPGGIIMVSDLNKDVKPVEVKDVTNSSYADQDRLNVDIDDIMGSFSQSSVASNRKIGETVGGISMVKDNANVMTEYSIRTFAETFVEDVMRDLVDLEKFYETDQRVLSLARDRAVGIPAGQEITPQMLQAAVDVTVDVGYGATDPVRKIQKFAMALNTIAVMPATLAKLKEDVVVAEVFGGAGYRNGAKFFNGLGEEAAQQPAGPNPEQQIEISKLELIKQKQDNDFSLENNRIMVLRELEYAKMALEKEIKVGDLYEKLGVKQGDLNLKAKSHDLEVLKEMGRREEHALQRDELTYKEQTGKPGI